MSLTIRLAVPADVPALADLAETTFRQTFVEGFAVGYPEADLKVFCTQSYAHDNVARWITEADSHVLVAEEDGRLLAYAHSGANNLPLPEAEPGFGELKRIYVLNEAQGRGLGRELLERALEWLGARPVLLGVWSENHKAQRLYRNYGFERVGDYKFMVGSVADEEFILRRG